MVVETGLRLAEAPLVGCGGLRRDRLRGRIGFVKRRLREMKWIGAESCHGVTWDDTSKDGIENNITIPFLKK